MRKRAMLWLLVVGMALAGGPAQAMQLGERSAVAPFGYGHVLADDGYIYYSVQTEESSFTLFRMTADGESAEMITPADMQSLTIAGDMIYFDDSTDTISGVARMRTDGTDKTLLYPLSGYELQVVGDMLYCVADNFEMESSILCMPIDSPAMVEMEPNAYSYENNEATYLPVHRPRALRWHDGWLYYTSYLDEGGMQLGRIRPDGTGDEVLIDADVIYDDINILGFDGETLLFSTMGLYSNGTVGGYSDAAGLEIYDLPQCFAYDDGYFYYSDKSSPSLTEGGVPTGIFRCHADGSDETQVTDADLEGWMEICGGWIFATVGGGLNAEAVMVPKDGSAPYRTVPGFGEYDYEANKPVDDTPKIEWHYADYGTGNVELVLRAYEQPAAFRLMTAVDGEPDAEVLYTYAEPHTVVTFSFDAGAYILKTAEGASWISDAEAFGPGGTYSTTQVFDFVAGRSYEIRTTTSQGSFYQDSASGFTQ